MTEIDTVVIGAGHNGLGVSQCLRELGVEHVVLERGDIANSWRKERWDSLTLLTPNWQSRLPGYAYDKDDPDGYMDMPQLIGFLDDYAAFTRAPVQKETEVTCVAPEGDRYRVSTSSGEWLTRSLVVASGYCNAPALPRFADQLPDTVVSVTPHDYDNPDQLPEGGVLVVGASATGLQLSQEIQGSGRPVTIAVGEHVRLPRIYRGRDILWWMEMAGVQEEGLQEIDDIVRARNIPSPQLVGSRQLPIMDLNAMRAQGVQIVGKLMGVSDGQAQFSGSLRNVCSLADLKMGRLLKAIDEWAESSPDAGSYLPPEEFERTIVDDSPALGLDLANGEIKTVLWATGFKPQYDWLQVPVLDRKGRLRHEGGVVDAPGVYAIGLPFLRRRKSSFIYGCEDDARHITAHLANYLGK